MDGSGPPFVGLESCVRDYVASLYLEFEPHPQPPLPTRVLEKSEYIWKMLNLCSSLSRNKKMCEMIYILEIWVFSIIGVLIWENQGKMLVDVQMEGWLVMCLHQCLVYFVDYVQKYILQHYTASGLVWYMPH